MRDLGRPARWLVADLRSPAALPVWPGVQQVCDPARAATFMPVSGERGGRAPRRRRRGGARRGRPPARAATSGRRSGARYRFGTRRAPGETAAAVTAALPALLAPFGAA